METVQAEGDNPPTKTKHAVQAQNLFRRIAANAEAIGMKINESKTNQLLISDSLSFKADAFITTGSGERIGVTDKLKLVGFTFGSRPTCHAHLETV